MSGAKAKGRSGEHEVARLLGGKRMILSGGAGGGDVWVPENGIYSGLSVEVKRRKRLPKIVTAPLLQAEAASRGTGRYPLAAYREDRGRWAFAMFATDFVGFTSALAEVGQGQQVRSLARELDKIARRLREVS